MHLHRRPHRCLRNRRPHRCLRNKLARREKERAKENAGNEQGTVAFMMLFGKFIGTVDNAASFARGIFLFGHKPSNANVCKPPLKLQKQLEPNGPVCLKRRRKQSGEQQAYLICTALKFIDHLSTSM